MSVKQMTLVWDLDLPHNHQSVLLVLADHAEDDGTRAYPSVDKIAWKSGYKKRQVQRILRDLEDRGLIEVSIEGGGRGMTTHYTLRLEKGVKKSPFVSRRDRAAKKPVTPDTVSSGAERVSFGDEKGVIAVTPDPSLDPSIDPSVSSVSSLRSETGAGAEQKFSTSNRSGRRRAKRMARIGDDIAEMAGVRPVPLMLHSQRSQLMGELATVAWRSLEPPKQYSTRASEADILGDMLERQHRTFNDISIAIRGAREILGPTDPFSVKVLVNHKVFRRCVDAGLKRLSEESAGQTRALLARLLHALTAA